VKAVLRRQKSISHNEKEFSPNGERILLEKKMRCESEKYAAGSENMTAKREKTSAETAGEYAEAENAYAETEGSNATRTEEHVESARDLPECEITQNIVTR